MALSDAVYRNDTEVRQSLAKFLSAEIKWEKLFLFSLKPPSFFKC